MTQPIAPQASLLSPFRFDTAPQGEADAAPDRIAVLPDGADSSSGWGKDGFSFSDLLDIINPLQHIPFISTIYREVTGDEIAAAPKVIGGALFGGPLGLIAALGDTIVEAETGDDFANNMIAMVHQPGPGEAVGEVAAATGQLAVAPEPAPAPGVATGSPGRTAATLSAIRGTPPQGAAKDGAQANTAPNNAAPRLSTPRISAATNTTPIRGASKSRWFSLVDQPVKPARPVSAAATHLYAQAIRPRAAEPPMQSVSSHALDRLIARSNVAAPGLIPRGVAAKPAPLSLPTDPNDVQKWMLQTLGKYETMQKR